MLLFEKYDFYVNEFNTGKNGGKHVSSRCSNMMSFRCKELFISRCKWLNTNRVEWHMENVAQKNSWLKSYFVCIFNCFHLYSAVKFYFRIASISCNGFYLRKFMHNCNLWQPFYLDSIIWSILCSDALTQHLLVCVKNFVKECSFWMWLCLFVCLFVSFFLSFFCEYSEKTLPLNNIDEIYSKVMLKAIIIIIIIIKYEALTQNKRGSGKK